MMADLKVDSMAASSAEKKAVTKAVYWAETKAGLMVGSSAECWAEKKVDQKAAW